MSRKWIVSILILVLGFVGAGMASAKEQYVYSVKFVCGYNPDNLGTSVTGAREGEPPVKFGNYATEINIVWPEIYLVDTHESAYVSKHLVVLVDRGRPVGREPNVAPGKLYADSINLTAVSGTMDDCNRIAEILWGAVPTPYPLTIGYLVLASTHEIDVTAVYTSQACSYWTKSPDRLDCLDPNGTNVGVSSSIDVERIPGRRLIIP
ncbi:MAG TPA: hypothetical protein VEW48_02655 [Thermoanaerobaculia bacterium]|nr:hypothetical protein [Thermoanaerobaculia bacterium]